MEQAFKELNQAKVSLYEHVVRRNILNAVNSSKWTFAPTGGEYRGPSWKEEKPILNRELEAFIGDGNVFGAGRRVPCRPGSFLIIIKAQILISSGRVKESEMRQYIRDYFNDKGNVFFESAPIRPRSEIKGYQPGELLPGDQIWFYNPYLKQAQRIYGKKKRYAGQQGSNVFYIGNGQVIALYPDRGVHGIYTIEDYQRHMMTWASVRDMSRWTGVPAKPGDFPILGRRIPKVIPRSD